MLSRHTVPAMALSEPILRSFATFASPCERGLQERWPRNEPEAGSTDEDLNSVLDFILSMGLDGLGSENPSEPSPQPPPPAFYYPEPGAPPPYRTSAAGLGTELLRPDLDAPQGPALHGRFLLAPPGRLVKAEPPGGRRRLRLRTRPGPRTARAETRGCPGSHRCMHAGSRRPPLSPDGPLASLRPVPATRFRRPSAPAPTSAAPAPRCTMGRPRPAPSVSSRSQPRLRRWAWLPLPRGVSSRRPRPRWSCWRPSPSAAAAPGPASAPPRTLVATPTAARPTPRART